MENIIRKFEWESRWLKPEEYSHILTHVDSYCSIFGFSQYPKKLHPLDIYSSPSNGLIYFLEGSNIDLDFGFPRVEAKKTYKWKKMSFTSELPKKKPLIRYLVASASKLNEKTRPSFRMHAVSLHTSSEPGFILCHVRKLNYDFSQAAVKRAKLEAISPVRQGLYFLLDAAKNVISPVKDTNKENDYVRLFNESKVDKFPALSAHFKTLFAISKVSN
jgi:hypothetical protein